MYSKQYLPSNVFNKFLLLLVAVLLLPPPFLCYTFGKAVLIKLLYFKNQCHKRIWGISVPSP